MTNQAEQFQPRDGRCEWCNGSDEGPSEKVDARGRWWHRECAEDCLTELEEALS